MCKPCLECVQMKRMFVWLWLVQCVLVWHVSGTQTQDTVYLPYSQTEDVDFSFQAPQENGCYRD